MDFATRDQYRHAVERISKGSPSTSEFDVAQMVVDLSSGTTRDERFNRKQHIGYYLVGEGVAQVEKAVHYRPPLSQRLHGVVKRYPTVIYLGALMALTGLCLLPTFSYARSIGLFPSTTWLLVLLGLSFIPASELALCFLNHTITLLVKPKPLPSMNTENGIPATARTMVVIPMLLTKYATHTHRRTRTAALQPLLHTPPR
jgi:cyclic beta-1,2-glucan synthetase